MKRSAILLMCAFALSLVLPVVASAATTLPANGSTVTNAVVTLSTTDATAGYVEFVIDGAVTRVRATANWRYDPVEDDAVIAYYFARKTVCFSDRVGHTVKIRQNGVDLGTSTFNVNMGPSFEGAYSDGTYLYAQFVNNSSPGVCNIYPYDIETNPGTMLANGTFVSANQDSSGLLHPLFRTPLSRGTKVGTGYACDLFQFGFKANEAPPSGLSMRPTITKAPVVQVPTCIHYYDTSDEGVWDHEHTIGCAAP